MAHVLDRKTITGQFKITSRPLLGQTGIFRFGLYEPPIPTDMSKVKTDESIQYG
jgi:hypothetical protein